MKYFCHRVSHTGLNIKLFFHHDSQPWKLMLYKKILLFVERSQYYIEKSI